MDNRMPEYTDRTHGQQDQKDLLQHGSLLNKDGIGETEAEKQTC